MIKASADLVLGENSFLGLYTATFSLCAHFLSVCKEKGREGEERQEEHELAQVFVILLTRARIPSWEHHPYDLI